MQKNFNGYLFALFAIFFWSFNVIYSKYLSGKLTPFEISFIRWLIPSLLFLPFVGKTVWTYRRKYLKVWPLILAMSFTGLGFQNTFVYYAGHTSNAVDMALIGASSPVFLLIFSALLLHKRITFFQIIGIICALAGVAAVILDGSFTDLSRITLTTGDFWMLCAAVSFAVYAIVQKKIPPKLPPIATFTLAICISTILFLPLAAFDFTNVPLSPLTKTDILILIVLAVFNSGIAYLSWNKALRLIGTVKTGTLYYLMPVFSTIEAYVLLNEQIYSSQIYGAVLVIAGIVISNISPSSRVNAAAQSAPFQSALPQKTPRS